MSAEVPLPMPPRPAPLWRRLPWPLPALLAWTAGWLAWAGAGLAGAGAAPSLAAGLAVATALSLINDPWRRRCIAAAGYPLSAWVQGPAAPWPPWVWGALLLPLLAVYPLRAWRDAPLFPTPADALQGLEGIVGQPACVLDAGCGLGHGLRALRRLWPAAELHGVEWSPLLAALAALQSWRTGTRARVRRGDMWAASWRGHDVVYLFQRPESMARAHDKAAAELAPGGWLVSLEFAVPGRPPVASLQAPGRRPVWIYQPAGPAPRGSTAPTPGR